MCEPERDKERAAAVERVRKAIETNPRGEHFDGEFISMADCVWRTPRTNDDE